jgi:hypothetical protein
MAKTLEHAKQAFKTPYEHEEMKAMKRMGVSPFSVLCGGGQHNKPPLKLIENVSL